MQARSPANSQGIDISSYQAGLDFAAVRESGVSVVYIKATQGLSYVNPDLESQYAGAKINGLKVGFYHYFSPGLDPEAQALWFISTLQGYAYDCILALDVEEMGSLNQEDLSKAVHSCLNEIAYLSGHDAMLYTYTSFVQNLKSIFVGTYPLWIADYNGQEAPGDNSIWNSWVGFQYSDTGNIGGIGIDLDEFTSTIFIREGSAMALSDALTILQTAGIITEPDYWTTLAQYVNYQEQLLINMAQYIQANTVKMEVKA